MASGPAARPAARPGAALLAAAGTLTGCLAGCTTDPGPTASGDTDGTSIVVAVPSEPASLNPLAGYAPHGAAQLYDGLVEHNPDLSLRPSLATALPQPSADGRSWTVHLRSGVKFSDGTALDPADVVATYRAVLGADYAAPVRDRFSMLVGVRQTDQNTVAFDLDRPYAPFPQLLTMGVLPAESLATPAPVTGGAVAQPPPGTGPYRLVDWQRGQRMVLSANPDYFGGRPAIDRVTVEFVGPDADRLRRAEDGTVDATTVPCAGLGTFTGTSVFDTSSEQRSGELRTVLLPAGDPVTGDPAVRRALNIAVDRAAMVTGALGGKGTAAYTPVPTAAAEFVQPDATFDRDVAAAGRTLDRAGWVRAANGTRARGATRAQFGVRYPAGDDVADALITRFTADAAAIGITVTALPVDPDSLASGPGAALLRIGGPFDPDQELYPLLHSPGKPGGYSNPAVDTALRTGRTATDQAQRATAYRQLQRAYLNAPGMVVLVAPDHCYLVRRSWNGFQPVPDGTGTDLTWGPWWNLDDWTPR